MGRPRLFLLFFPGLLLAPPQPFSSSAAQAPVPKADALRTGMTPAQVRAVLGPPSSVSRQILLFRVLEQWHYSQPLLRLSFDCRRGSTPRLMPPAAEPVGP